MACWLMAPGGEAITWTNVDFHYCGIHLKASVPAAILYNVFEHYL